MTATSRPEGRGLNPNAAPGSAGARAAEAAAADTSITGLLRRLADDTTTLVSKEIALARAEVGRSVDSLKAAIASMVIGAVVLICGLGVLLSAAVYALVELADMQRWTAPTAS